jgi:hypothetical protein
MTLIDITPRPVEAPLDAVAPTLDQEWCSICVPDEESAADPDAGIPQNVISRYVEHEALPADWLPEWGSAGEFEVTLLSCGHHLSRRL